MKARWIFVGVALAALVALSVGYAVAGSPQQGTCQQQMAQEHGVSMQQLHSQMPAAAQAQCDQLHTQMMNGQMGAATMGSNGMMGGHHTGGIMGG
ncbi:MAG: hypothetical protein WEB06_10650 [Actinomycetota bacterium]